MVVFLDGETAFYYSTPGFSFAYGTEFLFSPMSCFLFLLELTCLGWGVTILNLAVIDWDIRRRIRFLISFDGDFTQTAKHETTHRNGNHH